MRTNWQLGVLVGSLLGFASSCALAQLPTKPDDDPGTRNDLAAAAARIHRGGFVFDGHNDLPWELRKFADPRFERFDIAQPQPKLHTDVLRLRRGNVGAQFWSAYVPAETSKRGESLRTTLEQIELIRAMIRRYPDVFEAARTADDVERIRRSGKIASLIGIEGGHSIENSLGALRQLHALGAGYMTLTHSDTLDWADSATDERRHGGLTAFGEEVVREMNRLGMLVDISHVSVETMHDVLDITLAPVIASHSSAFAVAQHPRNVPDDVLKRLPANGGVVLVNFFSGFIEPESAKARAAMFQVRRELTAKYPDPAEFEKHYEAWQRANPIRRGTVATLVDHIDHIVKTAGINHVGIGSDYDGISLTPEGLEDVSCYPNITQELLRRGYAEAHIHQILSGNLLRAMRGAERATQASHEARKSDDVDLIYAGDIMLADLPGEAIARGVDPFAEFADVFRSADAVIGNLECVIATTGEEVDKPWVFRAHPQVLPVLAKHVDVVSLANNHTGDFGHAAFHEQLQLLEKQGLPYFGGGRNCAHARTPHILDIRGVRIALLGYNEFKPRSFEAGPTWPGVAWSVDEQVVADIQAARSMPQVDLVIPYMHWGWENEPETDRQKELARKMIDAGADVVVGGHPHVTQGVEYYKGKLIVYSLGNFVFDGFDPGPERTGWLLRLRLNRKGLVAWDTVVAELNAEGLPHLQAKASSPSGIVAEKKIVPRRSGVDSPLSARKR